VFQRHQKAVSGYLAESLVLKCWCCKSDV